MKSRILAAVLLLLAAGPVAAQSPQKIDPAHSSIRFVTRQMNVPVEGQFKRFEGSVAFDAAHPEATKAEFDVDLASIDLGSDEGTTEARRKSWLDVAAFPRARFAATAVRAVAPGRFEARGALSIKGVTREIVAPFTLAPGQGATTVEGQFTLKRLQFRVGEGEWADTDTVADDVVVRFRFTLLPR